MLCRAPRVKRLQRRERSAEPGFARREPSAPRDVRKAPLSGVRVLSGSSSKAVRRSIGNHPDVLAPFGTLLEDEPLEVRELTALSLPGGTRHSPSVT